VSRQLIVNADDYGRSPGVSRGILQAHREGIVTSTTVMINQPGVEDQLAEALDCPGLGVGLHLTFSAWRPVLPAEAVPGLLDEDGMFLEQHTLWAQAEEIPLDQLRAELAAQVDRFVALAGGPPDHLDCHHFAHLYPPFFQVYADLRQAVKTLPFLEGFPRDLVRGMIATNSALVRSRRLAHPDHFVSTFFGRKALVLDNLLALLDALPEGVSELMCHPGYDDPALAPSAYRAEREMELALLTHPAVRERISDLGIELVTFGVLA
jgi:predicted glycoside hydrolase/deacetylase ChbG (UPF0249 family)